MLLGIFLVGDTALRRLSQDAVTSVKTAEAPVDSTRVSPGASVQTQILPPASMDARWWVIHADHCLRGESLRIRHTSLDNAPSGREVHWSSGLVWLLAVLAVGISSLTGAPSVRCLPEAAFWAGPVMLICSFVLLGWIIARRFGLGYAGIFLLLFGTSPTVYQCFRAGEADHHGIVCAFAVASVLSLVAGGGGLTPTKAAKSLRGASTLLPLDRAHRWFLLAGALGGAALWVSAATFLPILAGCALGGLAATVLRDRQTSTTCPNLWMSWAVGGCLSSLFFYLLEYFPGHMGWRLEVNHPLYALAWLGGGALLDRIHGKLSGKPLLPKSPKTWLMLAASLVAVAIPGAMIMLRSHDYFWVSDKFLLLLHNRFISEFQSFPRSLIGQSVTRALVEMFTWPLFVVVGVVYLHAQGILSRTWRSLLALALAPTLIMQALAFLQIRWAILSSALWLVCALIILIAYFSSASSPSRFFFILLAVALVAGSLSFPIVSMVALASSRNFLDHLPKEVISTVILRDVAHRLVQSSPQQLPVVLAGPNSSTDLSYYAGIRTLGTLYWENKDGLKKAARIFAAPTEEKARSLMQEAQVTHIVVATWDDFARPYVALLRESGEEVPADGDTFLEKILGDQNPPDWLRPLYYPIPGGFGIQGQEIRIYLVAQDQSHAEALLHRGIFQIDKGDLATAEKLLKEAAAIEPSQPILQQYLQLLRTRTKP